MNERLNTEYRPIAYKGIKEELQPFVDETIYEQLVISLSVIKTMKEDCVIYSYHRALCDYWFEKVETIDES